MLVIKVVKLLLVFLTYVPSIYTVSYQPRRHLQEIREAKLSMLTDTRYSQRVLDSRKIVYVSALFPPQSSQDVTKIVIGL